MMNSDLLYSPTLESAQPQKLDSFLDRIGELINGGYQPLAFFGTDEKLIYALMGRPQELELICTAFPASSQYPSLTPEFPAFHIFERELYEEYEIVPLNHPWLKGLRHPSHGAVKFEDYPFFKSDSRLIHEVGVGPVHAGVIEPGHFRFLMQGEIVEHLEIQLGYQHRGLIGLLCDGPLISKMPLAETIAGDTVIGHGTAFCRLVESLAESSPEANDIRILLLEMERVAMHLSTLSALAGDVAYIMSQNLFAALRTTVINATLSICGSRFGKRALCVGGVNYPLNKTLIDTLKVKMQKCAVQIKYTSEAMFASNSLLSRFDDTGKVSHEDALRFGFTGISAKASGVAVDARADYPIWAYPGFEVQTVASGDVYARAYLRYKEIMQSLHIIQEVLEQIDPAAPIQAALKELVPGKIAISIVEGARGRIVHIAKSKDADKALWYRIIDPSLTNWQALAMAVAGEQVSDFPLCNKSFDLSYCGSDL
ncbi:MAG: NADH-quinone oxidoreductase subunit C [Candidatus Cloacimonetes bacterium]|nr:NADH-quinone oxidoreductase subunit C [Candidatus Cloacimonadota bacterium]MCB5254377.1 NADH-quinone oxidoreductase subunit C [Candidatus Cloacimonadota bacterium]MCK9241981.1 NADH-quinone oxidoreductase subunit C [Candidatus Cloacimonadota bacterium]MDD3103103.1 NADH-quinone oxidoreductase subunit C [Candidatus Cloacimonadota bacterium]MDD3532956.1 NADH-quinone oxidoreductase subunit C [Candidatus Cloacimonadota bacterium]